MIPFEYPNDWISEIARGSVYRIGTTLRDHATGRVVAHLQETSLLHQLPNSLHPISWAFEAGELASSVAANFQLQQIKWVLEGLQLMSAATLAATAAGIGVSVAGFALIDRRLRTIEEALSTISDDLLRTRQAAERIERTAAFHDRSRLASLFYQCDEAWVRSDPERVWRDLLGPLDEEQRFYRALVSGSGADSVLVDEHFTMDHGRMAYEATISIAALRFQLLLLLNELEAAKFHANDFRVWHESTVIPVQRRQIAAAAWKQYAKQQGISEENDARNQVMESLRPFIATVHEVQLQAGDRITLLKSLREKGMTGREFLQTAREITDLPVVVMPTEKRQRTAQ
jgi:uncharacterized Zn ribbon protein